MPTAGAESNEFERLKSVLFSPEAAKLSALQAQIEGLENWVGDRRRLEAATAEILVEAMRRAETARHRELAAAIAPLVVAAIHSEIHNSRDQMVEALYPITGRMVAAAVANAFRDLVETINQRLDAALSTSQWRMRARALVSGRSVAEIALAEAGGSTFRRILLLERGSGRLLAMWRAGGTGGAAQDNPELVSGLVAAISEFAASALSERHGELRSLDLGASQVYLRASSRIILAAETLGPVEHGAQERIDQGFLALVDRRDRGEEIGEGDLARLALATVAPARPRRGSRLRWAAIGLAALLALGWGLKGPVYRWRKTHEIDAAFAHALGADVALSSYPLALREDWTAGTLTLSGLAGSSAAVERLVDALKPAAAPLFVKPQVQIVPSAAEVESAQRAVADATTALRGQLDASQTEIDSKIAKFGDDLAAQMESLKTAQAGDIDARKAQLGALETRLGELQAALGGLQASLADPRRRIAEAAREAIVFFADDDKLANAAMAAKTVEALAGAIKATGEGVRVVGYADESGPAPRNVEISRVRAEAVVKMLVAQGVPAKKLQAVGRDAQSPIADSTKEMRYRNRRVTFEPLYPPEQAP